MGTAAQSNPVDALPEQRPRSGTPARPRVVAPAARLRRNLVGPLLIASGKGGPLDGALRLAAVLARRDGVNAHVLGFARPLSSPSSYLLSRAANLEPGELEACRRQAEHARLRRHIHETVGLSSFFSTAVESRELVSAAADTARVRKVEYVLVGLPRFGAPGRAGAEDTALRLAEVTGVPVLAVPADTELLPRSALVNMDFGEASMRAVRATLPLLTNGGSLTLAHVVPEVEFARPHAEGRVELGARALAKVVHRLRDDLRLGGNLEVRAIVVEGDPAEVLLELARDFNLTAVGALKRRSFGRFLMGSVSAGVLRGAGGPVLIVPPPGSAIEREEAWAHGVAPAG
jgi:nucleotide-binding universal stress UspA family protein